MIIQQAGIQMQASRAYVEKAEREEKLTMQVTPRERGESRDTLNLTDEARRIAEEAEADSSLDPRMRVVKMLLERLTGKPFHVYSSDELATKDGAKKADAASEQRRVGWSMEYERRESYYEAEHTEFSAAGVVKTADGREISFELSVQMSREYAVETGFVFRAGDTAVDPLVLNFDGSAAELTSTKFAFDLNTDGRSEQVSFVGSGSGFLVLDRNRDGVVNDGSELFGPRTGDGFDELRAYDGDANNWIDEQDEIYDQLKIWAKDHQGRDTLHTLREREVGAIFLGNTATPFSVTDSNNERLGQVAASGVYLKEDGTPGVVQQINLMI